MPGEVEVEGESVDGLLLAHTAMIELRAIRETMEDLRRMQVNLLLISLRRLGSAGLCQGISKGLVDICAGC